MVQDTHTRMDMVVSMQVAWPQKALAQGVVIAVRVIEWPLGYMDEKW